MKTAAIKTVGRAASERIMDNGPGPFRALFAAAITGGATAALTYRLLRGNAD